MQSSRESIKYIHVYAWPDYFDLIIIWNSKSQGYLYAKKSAAVLSKIKHYLTRGNRENTE